MSRFCPVTVSLARCTERDMLRLFLVLAVTACGGDAERATPATPPIVAVRDARIRIAPIAAARDARIIVEPVRDRDGDEDGCPDADHDCDPVVVEADRDTDDLADVDDRCPDAPPDNAGYEDIDGCPEPAN